MFRWVVLQLAELEKCSSRYEIDKQLAELPEGLDETYNRILIKHRQETLPTPGRSCSGWPFAGSRSQSKNLLKLSQIKR